MIARFAAAATTALLALAVLVGCSGPTVLPTEPDGGNGSSSDSPSPAPSGEDVDTGDGADSGTYVIPPTFPADVPIIEGDVVYSADLGTGWILWLARDDYNGGYDEAKGLLTDAGYAGETSAQVDEGSVGQFTTDKYTITLTAGDDPDYGKAVGYTVVLNG